MVAQMEPTATYASGETPRPGDSITYRDGRTARVHGWASPWLSAGKILVRWDFKAGKQRRATIDPANATLIQRAYPEVAA